MGSRSERRAQSRAERRTLVGRAPVLAFFLVTFAWSWGYWALASAVVGRSSISSLVTLPGLWGPAIAAVVVVRMAGRSVRSFLGRILDTGVDRRWYVVAFGGAIAVGALPSLVQGLLAGTGFELEPGSVVVTTAIAVFAGGSEELGLRGVAHPHLRERYHALGAGLLIGVVWVGWHAPLQRLGVGFDGPFLLFVAPTIAISVLLDGSTTVPAAASSRPCSPTPRSTPRRYSRPAARSPTTWFGSPSSSPSPSTGCSSSGSSPETGRDSRVDRHFRRHRRCCRPIPTRPHPNAVAATPDHTDSTG